MDRFTIIADDLTGACDTGVKFRNAGWETTVVVDAAKSPGLSAVHSPVVAINTGTRSAAPEEALGTVEAVLRTAAASGKAFYYKKVDSVLRGNCAVELEAFFRILHSDFALVAPAFPATGRRMRDGVIYIGEEATPVGTVDAWRILGDTTRRPRGRIQLETVRKGVRAVMERAEALYRQGSSILLADAWSEEDLKVLAEVAIRFAGRCIPVGSAGLAGQLAQRIMPAAPILDDGTSHHSGIVLLAVGTRHPVTVEQVSRLREKVPMHTCLLEVDGLEQDNLEARVAALVQALPAAPSSVKGVLLTTDRIYAGAERCSYLLQQNAYNRTILDGLGLAVEQVAKRLPVACIVASGGDVAGEILRRLQLNLIRLVAEPIPGVVIGIATGEGQRQIRLATKSGGFGDPDALITLYQYLAAYC